MAMKPCVKISWIELGFDKTRQVHTAKKEIASAPTPKALKARLDELKAEQIQFTEDLESLLLHIYFVAGHRAGMQAKHIAADDQYVKREAMKLLERTRQRKTV